MPKSKFRENTPKFSKEKNLKGKKLKIKFLRDKRFQLSFGLFLLAVSLFLTASFISYLFTGQADQSWVESAQNRDLKTIGAETNNWLGITGATVSHYFIYKWFGVSSFLLTILAFSGGYRLVFKSELIPVYRFFKFCLFLLFWISTLMGYISLNIEGSSSLNFLGGGIGYEFTLILDSLLGWGTFILLLLSLFVFIIYYFDVTSLLGFGTVIKEKTHELKERITNNLDFSVEGNGSNQEESSNNHWKVKKADEERSEEAKETDESSSLSVDIKLKKAKTRPQKREPSFQVEYAKKESPSQEQAQATADEENLHLEISDAVEEQHTTELENYDPTLDLSNYQYPSLKLMNIYNHKGGEVSKEELKQNTDKIIETLINFKIGISKIKATIGPTVTLYEIIPDPGVKISKIKSLEDDIALNLAALGIRIIAPIPGEGTIGIEVPNKNREMVSVRSVLSIDKFAKSEKELPIILGKTIADEVYITDLTKMPHLLIAGATGQGKSVGLNVVLTSLLYKKHPSQLKLILVDPKKVELTLFSKIEKHFLAKLPNANEAIITDTKKVIYTLNSLCKEMDYRYDLLKNAGCRNLKEYNDRFVKRRLNPEKGHRFLPYIVLVIDELADLMMTAGKEVETPIARLAQLARAIGIHLIIATQRPSVNVITGTIKANFPARISFRVTTKVDSRTILDMGGAEQLVGMGDMLLSQGSEMVRLQCPFIDTPEVERLCDFIGEQKGYDSAYLLPEYEEKEEENSLGEVNLSQRDPMFDEAARLVIVHQQGSTSLIQRKLSLGYNRAGRIIDQLEIVGIVGAFQGSKSREVLIHDEHVLEELLRNLS